MTMWTVMRLSSQDGTMYLLRTTDLTSWSDWDDGVRRAAFERGVAEDFYPAQFMRSD